MKKTSEPIIYLLICVSILITVSSACSPPTNEIGNLSLDSRAEDGSVSGRYHYPEDLGDHNVNFSVTSDGFATFHLKGAPESETLTVDLSDNQTASLDWNGTTLDGLGALTGEEQAALDHLMNSDLAHSLGMIPLDVGCQGDEKIDAEQVAALLVPLQMRFKYLISDREAETKHLIAISECGYGSGEENGGEKVSSIMFSPSMPVPVVFGYFPFDGQGAVEAPKSSDNMLQIACLAASPSMMADGPIPFNILARNPESISGIRINEKGPCNAMCRGACGTDCLWSNCKLSKELRCEKDKEDSNTGMEARYLIYDCGVHQGCIDHDNCYDKCNKENGCGTWEAADCRHGQASKDETAKKQPNWWYCDNKAKAEHGNINPHNWAMGLGPFQKRETFEYTDAAYKKQQNLKNCPIESKGEDEEETTTLKDEAAFIIGTYTGVTKLPSIFLDATNLSVEENEIILTVKEDGATHGEKKLIFSYTQSGVDGKLVYLKEEWSIIVEGKLTDAQGELKGTVKSHFVSSGPGADDPQDRTNTYDITYEIDVSGNIMSASLKDADVEKDIDIFSFELTKQ